MSAYTVDKATIDALLTVWLALDARDDGSDEPPEVRATVPLTARDLASVGQMLWDANYRSVNYRYGEKHRAPRYWFESLPLADLETACRRVLGAIHSLEYQSCETPDYPTTTAYRFVRDLRARACEIASEGEAWGWDIQDHERLTALVTERRAA
jgi:hypothetical protein